MTNDDSLPNTVRIKGTIRLRARSRLFVPERLEKFLQDMWQEPADRERKARERAEKRAALEERRRERRAAAERREARRKEQADRAYQREIERLHRVWEEKQASAKALLEERRQKRERLTFLQRREVERRQRIWAQSEEFVQLRNHIDSEEFETIPCLPSVAKFSHFLHRGYRLSRDYAPVSARATHWDKRNMGKKPRSRRPWQAD